MGRKKEQEREQKLTSNHPLSCTETANIQKKKEGKKNSFALISAIHSKKEDSFSLSQCSMSLSSSVNFLNAWRKSL